MKPLSQTLQYVAKLSRLDLNENELQNLSQQLQTILDFIDQLKKVDIANVTPTSYAVDITNVLREDLPITSFPLEKSLANAPRKKDSFFVVRKVID
ncbi:MAG: Asp-tRNA(Asn)/Glu-tRNA(Gln) amidotransferase subunit GatC [Candidatus Omnitrophica bacterium]|nr:Asp-tRNA(Asn)/Glu-tRNA(Gln) amidotransferase subunit GatC [Candidatus Omnitrophota bacterium]